MSRIQVKEECKVVDTSFNDNLILFDNPTSTLAKDHVDYTHRNCVKDFLRYSDSTVSYTTLSLPPLPAEYLDIHISNIRAKETGEVQNGCPFPFALDSVFGASVENFTRLTCNSNVKDIIDICFNVKGSEYDFLPGDTIGIVPCNREEDVNKILSSSGITDISDNEFILCLKNKTTKKKTRIPPHIPPRSSARHVLKTCVDIQSIPKKAFLHMLAKHTVDLGERRRLEELCSREGSAEYSQHILGTGVTLLDILEAFPSCHPPFERLLEHLPRLQARPYSIASSPLVRPDHLHIVFSLLEHPPLGLCTGWLHSILHSKTVSLEQQLEKLSLGILSADIKIPIYFRKSNDFHMPTSLSTPLILIGPGTGVAPFIGFLQHREAQKRALSDEIFGDIWLYFGCRYSDKDFIYRSELENYLENGTLARLYTSFSREHTGSEPRYVQDNIRLHSKEFIQQLLENNSTVFICGDAKNMAKDVTETIASIIQGEHGVSEKQALNIIADLKKKGRYLQDIWT